MTPEAEPATAAAAASEATATASGAEAAPETEPTATASPQTSPFFTNHACAHFPCHSDIAPAEFNCLFCYCPLYALGPHCEGRFTYTEAGIKDCSQCSIPHEGTCGNDLVLSKFAQLAHLASA